eukprot:2783211-Lingulodinium_polyedra.AAC.1
MQLFGVGRSEDGCFTSDPRALIERALPGWSEDAVAAIMRQRGRGEPNPVQEFLGKEVLNEMVAGK